MEADFKGPFYRFVRLACLAVAGAIITISDNPPVYSQAHPVKDISLEAASGPAYAGRSIQMQERGEEKR